ncbi:hypothetical protein Q5P01_023064 [Channa striata]|uniref:Uncharacterized protein n=1 Tax=Channa striata TaxID=64152 RepID=A0AA88IT48_CHASR|nr:hypothetical protein Q5P01_023064 [Channa striata]
MEENKSKVPSVTDLVRQRLQEVAEEICGLFERTIADYEDELSRLKENYQHLNLLDGVFRPKVHIRRSVCSADLQQTLVIKEEVLPEWNPSREQPDDPELLHVKEEQQELPTSGEGDPVDGLVKADITSSPFTAVPVRSEENKEEPQTSQLHPSQTEDNREAESSSSSPAKQMKLETDGEDCGGRSEPPRLQEELIILNLKVTYEGTHLDIKATMSPLGRAIMKVEVWDKLFSPQMQPHC